jgi:hypothetical protein
MIGGEPKLACMTVLRERAYFHHRRSLGNHWILAKRCWRDEARCISDARRVITERTNRQSQISLRRNPGLGTGDPFGFRNPKICC